MIDAGPSLRAAEGLTGSEVAAYLLGKGWAGRPSRIDGVSILSTEVANSDTQVELILPVIQGFDEEQRRIADALRTIGQLEKRSPASIASEIREFARAVERNVVETGERADEVNERAVLTRSVVLKRSLVIGGHKTSVSLEDEFWSGLKEIAAARNMTLSDLVATVERGRERGNLSSTLRLFVLESYRKGRVA